MLMSRRSSLNNPDVVVHTQVYRSRRRSGSNTPSAPSSRKNSLSEKQQEAYQHYDSESYWRERPPNTHARRKSKGHVHEEGGSRQFQGRGRRWR